jgi:CheY-like chemotaxis protein/two-component sensor histidine kinase
LLAGGIAHDLNNALGPLVALPDIILAEMGRLPLGEPRLGALRGDIESIKTASLRAAQTIKDLLTLGRQGRTVKEPLDLNRVVRTALADNSLRFANDGGLHVDMVVDVAPEPLVLRGSESQLGRAVANLVRNAVEAISGRGEIVVKTTRLDLAAPLQGYETVPPDRYALLSVSDNGCGIGHETLPHVFEPFFSSKRTGDSSGSGLGLAIVHGVVKEHDGFVDVVTSAKGSRFSLYLPLAKPHPEAGDQPADATGGHARILVVDDEPMQLRTCRRVLERLGYQVQTMESGVRAYELFNQAAPSGESPFDLVIMDMVLNEMLDGLQIFELIQRLFPAQKAIVASGHAPNERAALAVKKGLVWLAKPYSIEALSRAVERVLQRDV